MSEDPHAQTDKDARIAELEAQLADRDQADADGGHDEAPASYDPSQLVAIVDPDDEDAAPAGYGFVVDARDVDETTKTADGKQVVDVESHQVLTVALLGGGSTIVRPERVAAVGR